MRYVLVLLSLLLGLATSSSAQVSVTIGIPGMSIGFNQPYYPQLVRVPGYPVYYAPGLNSNFFFYDGLYWIYESDNWYASSWYNGPWDFVDPGMVPLYVLRIPVRYYRDPPMYFRGWRNDAPPRWGDHWGHGWEQQRSGWDRWNRKSAPAPAPLPSYQRKYSGDRYPQAEHQRDLRNQNYRYQPRDAVVRQHRKQEVRQGTPSGGQAPTREWDVRPQEGTRTFSPQRSHEEMNRPAPASAPEPIIPKLREPVSHERNPGRSPEQGASRPQQQPDAHQGHAQQMPESRRGQRQENQREPGEGRGDGRAQDRNK